MGWANKLVGYVTGNGAEVDANHNLQVNLPTTLTQAGFTQLGDVRDPVGGEAYKARVTFDGDLYSSQKQLLFRSDFNNATATPMSNQWSAEATTMTIAANAGFMRLNATTITTATTGVQLHSCRTFSLEEGATLDAKFVMKTTNGSSTNKQFDVGFGMAGPATGQGSAMNEFIGFRWTTAGGFQGVIEYSLGGAPTSLTVNLNGGVPPADNVARSFELIVNNEEVEFWIDNVFYGALAVAVASPGLLKGNAYPMFIRQFNAASAPALAPVIDVACVAVSRVGPGADISHPFRQSLAGRHCVYAQGGLTATDGQTATVQASGTAPTATAGSNTAAALTGLGGFFRNTLTGVTTTVHTNIICTDYTNPAIPTAAGAASDVRNLVITDLFIPACPVSVALTGGGFTAQWFIAIGGTAASLATTTANGTTALATKAPRIIPLPINDTYAATAAVGALPTRVGDGQIHFQTPLIIHPGEHVVVGFRTIAVTAAVTAGAIDGGIGFSGYWD